MVNVVVVFLYCVNKYFRFISEAVSLIVVTGGFGCVVMASLIGELRFVIAVPGFQELLVYLFSSFILV